MRGRDNSFFHSYCAQIGSGTPPPPPPIQRESERGKREADWSRPSRSSAVKEWSYTSTPQHVSGWFLVHHQGKLHLTSLMKSFVISKFYVSLVLFVDASYNKFCLPNVYPFCVLRVYRTDFNNPVFLIRKMVPVLET